MPLLLAVGGAALAPAAARYVPDLVIVSADQSSLQAVVGSLEHEMLASGKDGKVAVTGKSETRLIYSLTGTACHANGIAGCQGAMMQIQYAIPDTASYRTLADANLGQAAVNSWMDQANGVVGFTRYVVLDKGIAMANLRENLLVLLSVAPIALNTVKGDPQ